jgi:hypothetical protein
VIVKLTGAQCFYGLRYSLLIRNLWGLCFEPEEYVKEVWHHFSVVLLPGEKAFLCADICLKTLEID